MKSYNTASGMSCCNEGSSFIPANYVTLQYRKRYELLQQINDLMCVARFMLQYRKRYELLQPPPKGYGLKVHLRRLQYRKRYELLQPSTINVHYLIYIKLQYRKRYELLQLKGESSFLAESIDQVTIPQAV